MAFFIMHKFLWLEENGHASQAQIYSAIARPSIRGYVYVEAHFPKDVELFCQDFVSYRGDIQIVSVEDAQAVLGMTPSYFCIPKPDTWVCIKHGLYAGDIGFLRAVVESSDGPAALDEPSELWDCIISVIPRISDPYSPKDKHRVGEKRKLLPGVQGQKKRDRRPQAAFFDANSIIAKMKMSGLDEITIAKQKPVSQVAAGGRLEWQYRRNTYANGLLDLVLPARALNFGPGNPTANELKLWSQCEDLHVREQALRSLVQFQVFIWPGDRVEVISGPYRTLQGEVVNTDGVVIMVHFSIADIPPEATLKATEVRKIFKSGDYVRVMGGASDGKEGFVVTVSDGTGTIDILMSGTNNEVAEFVYLP